MKKLAKKLSPRDNEEINEHNDNNYMIDQYNEKVREYNQEVREHNKTLPKKAKEQNTGSSLVLWIGLIIIGLIIGFTIEKIRGPVPSIVNDDSVWGR